MADHIICPIISAGATDRPCVKEGCLFWILPERVPIGKCLFMDIKKTLDRMSENRR